MFQGRGILVEGLVHCQTELLTVQCAQDADILGGGEGKRENDLYNVMTAHDYHMCVR